MNRTRQRDYPVGIPVQPPPGWAGRRPAISPWRSVGTAGLLSLMVLSCMLVGWLSVQSGPRRTKKRPAPAAQAKAKPPEAEQERKPVPPVTAAPAEPRPKPPEPKPPEPKPMVRPTPPPTPGKKAEGKTPPALTRSYQKDIFPILDRNCTSCHGGPIRRGGVDVATYAAALKAVKPGMPDDSTLLTTIISGEMPPKKPNAVSEAERQLIRDWIAQGAKP